VIQWDVARSIERVSSLIQELQRVAVVDPETRISFLFARCRPTRTALRRWPIRAPKLYALSPCGHCCIPRRCCCHCCCSAADHTAL